MIPNPLMLRIRIYVILWKNLMFDFEDYWEPPCYRYGNELLLIAINSNEVVTPEWIEWMYAVGNMQFAWHMKLNLNLSILFFQRNLRHNGSYANLTGISSTWWNATKSNGGWRDLLTIFRSIEYVRNVQLYTVPCRNGLLFTLSKLVKYSRFYSYSELIDSIKINWFIKLNDFEYCTEAITFQPQSFRCFEWSPD